MTDIIGKAKISVCERYRYFLTREWSPRGCHLWIMLNPSTADALVNDPTITRIQNRTMDDKTAGKLEVVNLFAMRATDPKELRKASEPIGPYTDEAIRMAAKRATKVICAWGTGGSYMKRGKLIEDMLRRMDIKLYVLGLTKAGHPKHPLYIPLATKPVVWEPSTSPT